MEVALLEMIGQMVVIGFRGYEIAPGSVVAEDIVRRNIGGVVLFDKDLSTSSSRNIQSPEQVVRLSAQAKSLSQSSLWVSIDHEGGYVCRLKEKFGFPKTMTALKMAALGPEDFVGAADRMVDTLVKSGINLNFAPDVDVNVNPENPIIGKWERSFSSDPDVVEERSDVFIKRHRLQKVLTALKHFPGHGSSKGDSHLGMVDITDTWQEYELNPFEGLIKSGLTDSVMTAHVFNRHWDEKYPVTLSPTIIPDLLRKRLGFDGVVFSDDMQMGAITQHFGLEEAIRLAIGADVDVLVFGNNVSFDEHIAEKAIAIIESLVNRGEISRARIERSFRRIQKLKGQP
ncbi:MAG: glycoside hydrolase family 3 [Deltaproteobacteria bacterium]|nr:glycoside hydrolase family 3 [Deltaproteobacteria bacterium]